MVIGWIACLVTICWESESDFRWNKRLPIRRWSKRKDRGVSRSGQDSLCGESGNVLMLHMVTSGPSPGLASSPNTKDRHWTSQGLPNIVGFQSKCTTGCLRALNLWLLCSRIEGEAAWSVEAVEVVALSKLQCESEYERGQTLKLGGGWLTHIQLVTYALIRHLWPSLLALFFANLLMAFTGLWIQRKCNLKHFLPTNEKIYPCPPFWLI